jgi:hypothetical protein
MKRPDARTFLFDIQRASQLIARFTSGMTFPDYATDPKTRSAVERQPPRSLSALSRTYEDGRECLPVAS